MEITFESYLVSPGFSVFFFFFFFPEDIYTRFLCLPGGGQAPFAAT